MYVCVNSSMEFEWWTKALDVRHYGKLGHGPGFSHRGGKRLHHCLWSSQEKLTSESKICRYSFQSFANHTHSFMHVLRYPPSTQTGSFTPALLSSLTWLTSMSSACFWCSCLLAWPSQSPTWPTNTLTSPGVQRKFHWKTTGSKYSCCFIY